jgi:predicted alpha-1,6-mannanase (GH76 family)
MTDWKATAKIAVKVLQQWSGGPSGLYNWYPPNNSDGDYQVTNEAGIPNPNDNIVAPAIKAAGLWTIVCNTLRWWNSANAITALSDYSLITGDRDPAYLSAIDNTFKNGPSAWRFKKDLQASDIANALSQGNFSAMAIWYTNFINYYYDDNGWWALAWIKAYDLTGNGNYLSKAETIFQNMTGGWDGACHGGIYWQNDHSDDKGNIPYKNAIANELFLAVAAALYLRHNDQKYLDWANNEWKWLHGSDLIVTFPASGHQFISDSLNTSCKNDETTDWWTYNQGVILGALCDLFTASGQTQLLDSAEKIADSVITATVVFKPQGGGPVFAGRSGVNAQGILTECNDNDPNAGIGSKQFKGVFVRNLGYLYKKRPRARYRTFILNNAGSILDKSMNSSNQFGGVWSGPFDTADFVRQASAVDLLNAAASIPPEINYNSLRAFVLATGIPFPASVSKILNGAGSLRSVLLN